jgi:hypothetical protein
VAVGGRGVGAVLLAEDDESTRALIILSFETRDTSGRCGGHVADIDTSGSHMRLSPAGAPEAAAAGLECRA